MHEQGGVTEEEGEEAGSLLGREPDMGLNPRTPRKCSELKADD